MSRGGRPYIPRSEHAFDPWARRFWAGVDALVPNPEIPQPLVDAVEAALAEWQVARERAFIAQREYEAAVQGKAAARVAFERAARPLARVLQAAPGITDAERKRAGLVVREPRTGDRVRQVQAVQPTGPGSPPIWPFGHLGFGHLPPPTTAPLLRVDRAARFEHVLRLTDPSAPQRKAFPTGTTRAEVFLALGPAGSAPPADPSVYRYCRFTTSALVEITLPTDSPGLSAHYLARWIGRGGAPGPWSAVASATVAA